MTLKELKQILNSREDLDDCKVMTAVENEVGGSMATLTFVDVKLEYGNRLVIQLHGCNCNEKLCDHNMSFADAEKEEEDW